jgi:hypothetical protein
MQLAGTFSLSRIGLSLAWPIAVSHDGPRSLCVFLSFSMDHSVSHCQEKL